MTDKDPLEQAEDVLRDVTNEVAAEMTKAHAEMTLLCCMARKGLVQATFLLKAQEQGIGYMSGLLVAVGLTARTWGRLLADNPDMDFTAYADSESESLCADRLKFSHYLYEEILRVQDVVASDRIRLEIQERYDKEGIQWWAENMTHCIALYADLLRDVLDIRNGEFPPGDSDDR